MKLTDALPWNALVLRLGCSPEMDTEYEAIPFQRRAEHCILKEHQAGLSLLSWRPVTPPNLVVLGELQTHYHLACRASSASALATTTRKARLLLLRPIRHIDFNLPMRWRQKWPYEI